MKKQIIKFVIDKNLDIENHLIALNAYKRNIDRGFPQQIIPANENLLKLPLIKRKNVIRKNIEYLYKKERQLKSLAQDINKEWLKIEKDFIKKLEQVHKHRFPHKSVKGVLSSADKFGYKIKEEWFAVKMFSNKYIAIDTAMHELMHFMFHKYYWEKCENSGLSENKIWDIKEAFTVLLNLEFDKFLFFPDYGRAPHNKLRRLIEKSWKKNRDFDKTLSLVIKK
ncbi:MAG: hypothetical protein Q8N28_01660 [bacterium]|nr:hypothetical protein [bacterium]